MYVCIYELVSSTVSSVGLLCNTVIPYFSFLRIITREYNI